MLLTIATTHRPATDLGFLLHKAPANVHVRDLTYGTAHVFYTEASAERCEAALLLEIDSLDLVRRARLPGAMGVEEYINDRPYAASSFLSTAISRVYGTAMSGRCARRPELAAMAIPLEARIPVLACRPGDAFLRGLFEPLGYETSIVQLPLRAGSGDWGDSRYFDLTLRATVRLADLLAHLYVLIPVLDEEKHYWVGTDEIDKLLAKGSGWLETHPARAAIARRYLRFRPPLIRRALARLADAEGPAADDEEPEIEAERMLSLNEQRLGTVVSLLKTSGARRVLDLGCGEGNLIGRIAAEPEFTEILGVDVSANAVAAATRRIERLPSRDRSKARVLQGSLLYDDERLAGWDAAVLVEVVEHVEPDRLPALEAAVFGRARPGTVVVTTPNREYNARFDGLAAGHLRHRDHRFEWSRAEFQAWIQRVEAAYPYTARVLGIGSTDPELGSPTQAAVFGRWN